MGRGKETEGRSNSAAGSGSPLEPGGRAETILSRNGTEEAD